MTVLCDYTHSGKFTKKKILGYLQPLTYTNETKINCVIQVAAKGETHL